MKRRDKKELQRINSIIGDKKIYEMDEEQLEEPITKEMAELCRHRLEKRWYRRLVTINFLLVIAAVSVLIYRFPAYKEFVQNKYDSYKEMVSEASNSEANDESEDEAKDESKKKSLKDEDKKEDSSDKDKEEQSGIVTELEIIVTVLGFFIILIIVVNYFYAQYRANAVRITKNNFPEVYDTIEKYSKRLGIEPPKTYIMQSSGVLNAFSAYIIKKRWICINTELFEIAYREHKDMDSLNFIIAHELSHIYYKHATLKYNLLMGIVSSCPILGATASRAREYSCDRLAQRLTGVSGIESMIALVVDRHLYKMVDKEDYINEMKQRKGFFMWVVNLVADHPIMAKRIVALEDGKGSGKLY